MTGKARAAFLADVLIVVPTSIGGHIEQAANLALSLVDLGGASSRVTICSRPGAREYLGSTSSFTVIETMPALADHTYPWRLPIRVLRENIQLFVELARTQPRIVILEEMQFPVIRFFPKCRRIAILHNVVAHEGTIRFKRLRKLATQACLASADEIVVHGQRQFELLDSKLASKARRVSLPTIGPVEKGLGQRASIPEWFPDNFVACLGEIRENKGIHVAIQAAIDSGVPLLVAGKPLNSEYDRLLRQRIGNASNIVYVPRFLTRDEFHFAMEQAVSVILPYEQFDAQSAVLARAAALGRPAIVSRLPALVEQAKQYHLACEFVDAGDVSGFGAAMRRALKAEKPPFVQNPTANDWLAYAGALVE